MLGAVNGVEYALTAAIVTNGSGQGHGDRRKG